MQENATVSNDFGNSANFDVFADFAEKKIFVYNASDNRILYSANAEEETQIASLTKIMTALVFALENKKDLKSKITITEEMLQNLEEFVTIYLRAGQEATLEDLLYASLLPSAADAMQALAIDSAGSIEKFVAKMNEKVNELGLKHTHFSNVVGFDDDNYSCAEDVAVILNEAKKNKTLYEALNTFEKYLPSLDIVVKKTFDKGENFAGGKTGFTFAAGRNLASFSTINNAEILVVDLNENYMSNDHVDNSNKILNYYKENYSYQKILGTGDLISTLKINDSPKKELEVFAKEDVSKFLPNNFDLNKLEYKFDGMSEINSDIKLNDKIFDFAILLDGEELYSQEYYLTEEIWFYPYWLFNTIIAGIIISCIAVLILRHNKNTCKRRRG